MLGLGYADPAVQNCKREKWKWLLTFFFDKFFNSRPMKPEERAELKTKIKAAIVKTTTEVERLEEATKPIAPENAIGRVSRMDAINNKGVSEAALRSARRKLTNLKIALTKIDAEDFGVCVRCKRPIAPARLMYMPESTKCVRCADH